LSQSRRLGHRLGRRVADCRSLGRRLVAGSPTGRSRRLVAESPTGSPTWSQGRRLSQSRSPTGRRVADWSQSPTCRRVADWVTDLVAVADWSSSGRRLSRRVADCRRSPTSRSRRLVADLSQSQAGSPTSRRVADLVAVADRVAAWSQGLQLVAESPTGLPLVADLVTVLVAVADWSSSGRRLSRRVADCRRSPTSRSRRLVADLSQSQAGSPTSRRVADLVAVADRVAAWSQGLQLVAESPTGLPLVADLVTVLVAVADWSSSGRRLVSVSVAESQTGSSSGRRLGRSRRLVAESRRYPLEIDRERRQCEMTKEELSSV